MAVIGIYFLPVRSNGLEAEILAIDLMPNPIDIGAEVLGRGRNDLEVLLETLSKTAAFRHGESSQRCWCWNLNVLA